MALPFGYQLMSTENRIKAVREELQDQKERLAAMKKDFKELIKMAKKYPDMRTYKEQAEEVIYREEHLKIQMISMREELKRMLARKRKGV